MAEVFLATGKLPEHSQGKHIKTISLINDEGVQAACRSYLRSQKNDSITGLSFAKWVNEHLHMNPSTCLPSALNITERQLLGGFTGSSIIIRSFVKVLMRMVTSGRTLFAIASSFSSECLHMSRGW